MNTYVLTKLLEGLALRLATIDYFSGTSCSGLVEVCTLGVPSSVLHYYLLIEFVPGVCYMYM